MVKRAQNDTLHANPLKVAYMHIFILSALPQQDVSIKMDLQT
jgi:hypothetical protein